MSKTYDIAVLGATAAGEVAAVALAKKGRKVILVDGPARRTESPLADWIPADAFSACRALKAVKTATESPFRAMHFHSDRLDRQAVHRGRAALGFLVRSDRLLAALHRLAGAAGVERLRLKEAPRIRLEESGVVLSGKREVRAALLLIAQGLPSEAAANLALPLRPAPARLMSVCGLDVPLPSARVRAPLDGALHVVAFAGGSRLGMFFQAGAVLHVRIIASGGEAGGAGAAAPAAGVEDLGTFVLSLQEAGLLPERLDVSRATAAIWHPPGGAALELESLLAKRTLLIGTAGGFASALTGQTLDPAVRSAMVAGDVAHRALASRQVQEVLSDYKTLWRAVLADRLRPLGTSLQMLLPMVIANQAITARFARAFLYGQSL